MLKIISNYTLTQYLGKGQYGKVYQAIDQQTNENVAIKMISLDKFVQKSKLISLTKQQIQILVKVQSNENIIKFLEVIKSNRYLYLVYEFCNGGTLEEYIKQRGILPEKQAIKIFRQLVKAYHSLYENNIIHRDIKTDNIFFKDGKLKLADFGFCKQLKFGDDLTQTSLGSPLYMAPQVLNHDVYGSKADIWSCGIVLYQMLFGKCPYANCNIKQLLQTYSVKSQVHIPYQKNIISPILREMLEKMLCKDQFRRISWQQLFYEYSFSQSGQISHRQKDFQYDLMKLMKRNSSRQQPNQSKVSNNQKILNKINKFDWSKIIQMNSSVHSQECESNTQNSLLKSAPLNSIYNEKKFNDRSCHPINSQLLNSSQTIGSEKQISDIFSLKKKIKQFQMEHSKIYQLIVIIETMLQATKPSEYDNRVLYFLTFNLNHLLETNVKNIVIYQNQNQFFLQSMLDQKRKLEKLQRIFQKQLQNIKSKINQIKTTLLSIQEVGIQVFRYPKREIMRKYMAQFVQNYQLQSTNLLELSNQGSKEDAIKLLKILWAVNLILRDTNSEKDVNYNANDAFNYYNLLSIKQETSKKQISTLISRFLIKIGI